MKGFVYLFEYRIPFICNCSLKFLVKVWFFCFECRQEIENKPEDIQVTNSGILGADLSVSKYVSIYSLCVSWETFGFLVLLCVLVVKK